MSTDKIYIELSTRSTIYGRIIIRELPGNRTQFGQELTDFCCLTGVILQEGVSWGPELVFDPPPSPNWVRRLLARIWPAQLRP